MAEHIQIGDISPRIQYTGDGTQTQFTYPFPIFAAADMEVYLDQAKQSTGFTTNGAGQSAGGDVTFTTAPASGVLVTLRRRLAIQRTSDFQESGEFRSKVINDELDYLTAALQQVDDDIVRSVHQPTTDVAGDMTLPDKATRTDKALGFDASGDPTVSTKTLAQLETEADNAAASATAAATSATNAATSETNAATSATAASTAQTAAETAETNAETAETNAETAETNAAASASAASSSAAAAAASFDSFDDRYLGSKTSDPTLDNDGNALLDGALYFNTTANEWRVYDLGTTTWLAPTAAAAASAANAATSETNAATSETNAATSATSASTAQTNAETAETNAETAETNAASSATAAAASATAAAASAAMGLYKETQVKSAAYTVVSTDEGDLIKVDASGGAVTITLDALATIGVDFRCAVAKSDASANAVTVQRSSTDTINGATSITLTDQYELWDFVGDTSTGLWLGINGTASGITGGDGIDKTGGVLSVDLATNPGLEISGGKLIAKAGTNLSLSAGGIDAPATVGQAEAEAGTATTARIWTAQRVKQAIAALAVTGATDAEKANIILNAFRIAVNGGLSVQNMVDGVVDEFTDETGVDTATSTNEFYHTATDHYDNDGDTTTASTSGAWSGDNAEFTFSGDGAAIGSGNNGIYVTAFVTGDFEFEALFPATMARELFGFMDSSNTWTDDTAGGGLASSANNSYLVRGQVDDALYEGAQVATTLGMASKIVKFTRVGSTIKLFVDGTLAHTFATGFSGEVRLIIGSDNGAVDLDDINWTTPGGTVANMTLVSNATTALAQPDDAFIVLWQEDVDAITLNTDLTAEVSRDGGTTWTLATLANEATLTTGRILTATVDISSQPAGTSMKYRIKTLNTKEQKIHGVGLQWS